MRTSIVSLGMLLAAAALVLTPATVFSAETAAPTAPSAAETTAPAGAPPGAPPAAQTPAPATPAIVNAPTDPNLTTNPEKFLATAWDLSHKGREIDLSKYRQTFNDDFKAMNVVKDSEAPGPGAVWFAPGHGAFITNSPLRKNGPFALVDEGLRLRVEKTGEKRWKGACMTSVNTKGQGFAQKYGYFEMTAEYRYEGNGNGIWGAFWLKSQCDYFNGGQTTRTEIDLNEFYGDDWYHATVHLWPAARPLPGATITKHIFASGLKGKIGRNAFKDLKVGGTVKGFHRYGGEITPEWVIMYFDGKELGRFPTAEEFKTPLYILASLIINKPLDQVKLPMDLVIRNISAYQPVEPYKEK